MIIAASWAIFHEPPTLLQFIGGAAIVIGVSLIAEKSEQTLPRPY